MPSCSAETSRRKKSCPHKKLDNPDLFNLVKKLFLERDLSPEQKRSTGNRGAIRHLRHRDKPRRPKGYVSNRGKIPIINELSARPVEANERSRFLICRKLTRLGSKEVQAAMIEALRGQPLQSITPDRRREFQLHGNITKALGVEFYFPPPHQPWQRGTNENTNGLKGFDFNALSEAQLQAVVEKLNKRPRKCLGYKTQWEIRFSTPLHFV